MQKGTNHLQRLFWLDMEMTGLEPSRDRILEAAVVVTDLQFSVVQSYETAVFQTPELLAGMDTWCKDTHGKSGLTARVPSGISEQLLDEQLEQLSTQQFGKDKVVLCGNSIGQDRKFVEAYLPRFSARLHYRMLDVSSFKIVFENLFRKKFKKENKHTALADIHESINELKYYLPFLDLAKLEVPQ